MKIISRLSLLFLFVLSLLLNGCGGGGGGGGAGGGGSTSTGGSVSAPKVLRFPVDFPQKGVLRASYPITYYKVTGLYPNQPYYVTFSSTNSSLDFMGFQNSSYSGMWDCWDDAADQCTANAAGELYLQIVYISSTPPSTDLQFTINIQSTFNEGNPSSPVNLTGQLPYTSSLDAVKSRSFFVAGNLTPGNSYTVSLSSDSAAAVDIYVYQDAFTKKVCGNVNSCTLTAAGSQLWVIADGAGDYTLTLTDNGAPPVTYTAQGTSSVPQNLSYVADGVLASSEVDYTNSYYIISGLKPNTVYRTAITSVHDDKVDLFVYSGSSYATPACSSEATYQRSSERCLATSSNTGSLWVRVYGGNANQYLGSTYDISAYEYFPDEGDWPDRVPLSYYSGFSYNGTVDANSVYVVNNLQPLTSYVIDISNYAGNIYGYASGTGYYSCTFAESGPGVQRCTVTSDSNGEIDLDIYEGTYDGGTAFTLGINVSPYQDVGTEAVPEVITAGVGGVSAASSIGGYISYYRVDGLTANTAYTVSVDGMDANGHDFYLYDSDTALWSRVSGNYSCKGYDSTDSCTRRTIGTSMWLMVVNTGAINGAALTINVTESPVQSEGTALAPVLLQYGTTDLPYSGSTDTSSSYYEVQGVTAGTEYIVYLPVFDSSTSVNTYVYTDTSTFGSTVSGDYVCSRSRTSSYSGFCRVTPTSTSIWIMIDGDDAGAGAFYDLDVIQAPVAVTETIDTSLGSVFPHTSSTDTTYSDYTLTNLEPGQLYNVSVAGMSADVDLAVSSSPLSSYPTFCGTNTGTVDEQCLRKSDATTGNLYVRVSGSKTSFGAYYQLNVTPGYFNEGSTTSPVAVSHTSGTTTTRPSEVGEANSYYKVSGLTPQRMYNVALNGLTNSANLYIMNSTFSSTPLCSSTKSGTADELCGELADANGDLYIKVTGSTGGAGFNLEITDGLTPEGTTTTPLPIAYTGSLTTHNGQVDVTTSYYEITGLDPNTAYTISVTGMTDNVVFYVYETDPTSSYRNMLCGSYATGTGDKSCTATTPKGGGAGTAVVYVDVHGYNTVAGATFTLQVAP